MMFVQQIEGHTAIIMENGTYKQTDVYRRGTIYQRLTSNIRIDPDTGCWIWQGADSGTGRGGGYPRMSLDGRTVAVHRVMATHVFGFIPGNKHVDHKCRNRMCICPDHLEITTHRENCRRRDLAKSAIRER